MVGKFFVPQKQFRLHRSSLPQDQSLLHLLSQGTATCSSCTRELAEFESPSRSPFARAQLPGAHAAPCAHCSPVTSTTHDNAVILAQLGLVSNPLPSAQQHRGESNAIFFESRFHLSSVETKEKWRKSCCVPQIIENIVFPAPQIVDTILFPAPHILENLVFSVPQIMEKFVLHVPQIMEIPSWPQ